MSKGKKGGSGAGGEETPFQELLRIYPKKFNQLGLSYPAFAEKMSQFEADDIEFEQLHLWEPTNPNVIQCIFAAIQEAQIDTLKSIRFWKIKAQDEGVRALASFMLQNKTVLIVDLLDNEITPLGCEFLGRALHPSVNQSLTKLM